jgi:RHS repeat-associated protein
MRNNPPGSKTASWPVRAGVVVAAGILAGQIAGPASASQPVPPGSQPALPVTLPPPRSAAMAALLRAHGLHPPRRPAGVPGHHAVPVRAPGRRPPVLRRAPAPVFPAAGAAVITVRPASGHAVRPAWIQAPGMPVKVGTAPSGNAQPPAGTVTATRIRVSVLAHDAARAAGADGTLLTLSRADPGPVPARVRVRVSYAGFASAYGGDFGARMALFAMPACAVTTPRVRACQAMTPVQAVNHPAARTLTATVAAPPAGSAPLVLASSSTTSGGTGDFKATSLTPSSQWQVGLQAGDFTYSYPLRVPPPIAGAAPSLGLSYDSGLADGATAQANSQPGQLGEGFSLTGGGFIERKYAACGDHVGDATNNTGQGAKTGDMCWDGLNGYLSLGGHSGQLIRDTSGTWHLAGDDGSTVNLINGGTSNGAYNNSHWEIITPDGTQYWFGLNQLPGWQTGNQVTNSAWTMPIVGLKSGDPCNTAGSYANSVCNNMPWRWNLDLVVDPNGNATSYYYTPQANRYAFGSTASGLSSTWKSYTSGGTLSEIYYGSLDNASNSNNVYAHRPFHIALGYSDRCTVLDASGNVDNTTCDANHSSQADWPDTPWDLSCASSPCSGSQHGAPAFFDTQMLTSVTTSLYEGSNPYQNVDTWNLAYQWLPGDNGNSDLALYSISHAGDLGGSKTLPKVTFPNWAALANKAYDDGYPQVVRNRLTEIMSDTGARTDITYNPASCTSPSPPSDPSANTRPCFPQTWTPGDIGGLPKLSWFYKYTVSQVTVTDTTGGSPPLTTSYVYCDTASPNCASNSTGQGGAWHYDTDIDLVLPKHKSYGQWRGYRYVHVITGASNGTQTETDYTFLRGMDGDPLTQSGGGFTYRSVQVSPTRSSGSLSSVTDDNALSGFQLEKITLNGPGGGQVSDQISWPWTSTTATSAVQPWGKPLTAVLTGTAETDTYTPQSAHAGGGTRQVQVKNTFDPATGLPLTVSDNGDVSVPAQALCTTYGYPSPASAAGLINYPDEAQVTSGSCGASSPPLVSDTKYFYDSQAFGTAPTAGNVTETDAYSAGDPGTSNHWVKQSRTLYDAYGRVTSSQDAAGNTTTTSYVSSYGAGRPTTQVTVTSPLTGTTTATAVTDLEPAWALPTDTIDASGQRTDYSYDPLGRVTSVWLPGQTGTARTCTPTTSFPQCDGVASYTFAYKVTATAAPAVTAKQLVSAPSNAYTTTIQLYDSLLRPRQTQAGSELGVGTMSVTDTFYDSRGNVVTRNGPYDVTSAGPSTALWTTTAENQIPDETASSYDGANRVTESDFDSYGALQWKTTWSYTGGDAVTQTPPAGGTITTTYTDGRGRTSEIDQYHSKTSASGGYDATAYSYNPAGQLASITDPGGNQWADGYDLLGRQLTATTPDAGTTTNTYNDLSQLTSVTNAATKTVSFTYDAAGRKTAEYNTTGGASQTGSDQLAAWTYDTATLDNPALPSGSQAVGQPASSTEYRSGTTGAALTQTTGSYNPAYQPESVTWKIPSNAVTGATAGTYQFGYTYNADGTPASETYPQAGGLNGETVNYTYDNLGYPTATTSSASYYAINAFYDGTGQTTEIDLGTASSHALLSKIVHTYDTATLRLAGTTIARQSNNWANDVNITYGYDHAGNLTSASDSATGNNQCFGYDYLARFTAAWAQASSGCPASPPGAAGLGGPAPYQQTLTYDNAGASGGSTSGTTGQITAATLITGHGTSATTTQTSYTYAGYGASQPHAPTGYTTTTNGNPIATSQNWTGPGQLASTTTGGTTTSYNWNGGGAQPGQLAAITGPASTNYRYDAAGNLRVVQDGTTTTLYLPDEELTATGSTVTATRYYTLGGQTIAARTPSGLSWLLADPHGTNTAAIDTSSQNITLRYYTPFGVPAGPQPASWPGTRGYVGGTTDTTTGLTNLGARQYNPAAPAFISPDPLLTPYQPANLDPYDYAANNPATNSDPAGLCTSSATFQCPPQNGGGNGGGSSGGGGGGGDTGGGGGSNGGGTTTASPTPGEIQALRGIPLNLPLLNLPDMSSLAGLNLAEITWNRGLACLGPGAVGHNCSAGSFSWSTFINRAAAVTTGLALIPGVDVIAGPLAVVADAAAGLTNLYNTTRDIRNGDTGQAIADGASTFLSFAGAGIGGTAVKTSLSAARELGSARAALSTFNTLDHALPDLAPTVTSASQVYWAQFGSWRAAEHVAGLWATAAAAASTAEVLKELGSTVWEPSQ